MSIGRILLALLVIWVAFAVIGLVFKALFWLFVVGLVLFGITLATGAKRGNFSRR